jgi:hypothetical protein
MDKLLKNKKLILIIIGIFLIELSGHGIFATVLRLFSI